MSNPIVHIIWGGNGTFNSSHDVNNDDVGVTKYINDEAFVYITIAIATITAGLISVMGIVTNIINIIVFIMQGVFSDSSTVSLLSLGVADFLSAASMLLVGITHSIAFFKPQDQTWEVFQIIYMTRGWPRVISGLITRMITAFIAFERCFCVVFPFKVKNVFSPKCSFASMVSIFVYFILSYSPAYILNTFHIINDPVTNRSRLVFNEHPDWQMAQFVLNYVNLYTLNFCPVIIVLICTTITVSRVKLSSAWRESMSTDTKPQAKKELEGNSDQGSKLSSSKMQKEKKLIRMITLISTLFLISYMPSIALPVIYSYDREIRTDGKYRNLASILFSIAWCSETLNSSINIFIYYRMSSRYKKEFNKLFGIKDIHC